VKELIKFIITSIVDKPESFSLSEEKTEAGFINFIVGVDPEDMGKVIGRGGQIIKAIRILLRTKALQEGKKVILSLKED
jgi:predicted RNA-binding protein YlqC (UPF0109 family)